MVFLISLLAIFVVLQIVDPWPRDAVLTLIWWLIVAAILFAMACVEFGVEAAIGVPWALLWVAFHSEATIFVLCAIAVIGSLVTFVRWRNRRVTRA
jgi:hypothetical protein